MQLMQKKLPKTCRWNNIIAADAASVVVEKLSKAMHVLHMASMSAGTEWLTFVSAFVVVTRSVGELFLTFAFLCSLHTYTSAGLGDRIIRAKKKKKKTEVESSLMPCKRKLVNQTMTCVVISAFHAFSRHEMHETQKRRLPAHAFTQFQ